MKKFIFSSHSNRNIFLIPLFIASLLILGVIVYASFKGTEIRSKAANPISCTIAQKTGKGLVCPSRSLLQGNLCCQPEPIPKPVCKTGVDSLCMNTSCRNGYRYVTVTCVDGFSQQKGDASTCKTSEQWISYGEDVCKSRSKCSTPTPTPASSCTPNGSTCTITNCPPMPACPAGTVCTQVMPTCTTQKGICQNNRCVPYTLLPTPGTTYSCPETEWINCMPGPNMGVKQECTSEYYNWAKENCPNFKGIAR